MPKATLGKLVVAPPWEPSLERLLVEEREQPLARVLAGLPAPAQPQPPANVLRSFSLHSDGFGIEPEMTAKIFKRGYRVYEVPITYDGRGYDEGKKITWKDGVVALWVLLKYRFTE